MSKPIKAIRESDAYLAGAKARTDNLTPNDNPYKNPDEYTQWSFGWLETNYQLNLKLAMGAVASLAHKQTI